MSNSYNTRHPLITATVSNSVTGTPNLYLIGPPAQAGAPAQGLYIRENVSGSTFTYRWVQDQPLKAGSAAVSTFSAHGL